MKKRIVFLLTIVIFFSFSKTDQNISNNLISFAKVYGYVKYFHPSDEAANVDWNSFAAYGADQILQCKSQKEVISTLENLFKPLSPGIRFSEEEQSYDFKKITPENTADYTLTYWQHLGVSTDMSHQSDTYVSSKVNSYKRINEAASFGNLLMALNPEKYIGKEIKYTGWTKLEKDAQGTGHLWLRVDNTDESICFFENMGNKPIKNTEWKQYEIIGKVCENSSKILIGSYLKGKGKMYLDDVQLHYKENDNWIPIPLNNSDFEIDEISKESGDNKWKGASKGYTYDISNTGSKEGQHFATITYEGSFKKVKGDSIFEAAPKFTELIEKKIGDNIYCQIPLALYSNESNTYPQSNSAEDLDKLIAKINVDPADLSVRLGNVINVYNVFQHFYPYFDVVTVDWEKELEKALKNSFEDKTARDHVTTLQKFTAPLKDGHINVSDSYRASHTPPIKWEWIENKLIITDIFTDTLPFKIGDEVTQINNESPEAYFKEIHSTISAGTVGYLNYVARGKSLLGEEDTELNIEINQNPITLKRTEKYNYRYTGIKIQEWTHKLLENNIQYINLNSIQMDTITAMLPELVKADGIICDLRGYPNGNHEFISHLLKEKDTSTSWMQVPQIIYPDQEKITGYKKHSWGIEPKDPYLGDKNIVFIIDGRAISYAESYMGFIEGYKLATIIGQPTAGTNGNVNPFQILGNIRISWTGMKVLKHDGSQHHAIGVEPDINVNKTIDGVKAGRDEFLEKAIEIVSKK